MSARPAAVLWDLDGTIVDTERIWMQAAQSIIAGSGGVFAPDHERRLLGASPATSVAVLREAGVNGTDAEIFDRLAGGVYAAAQQSEPAFRAGALELITQVDAAGIPQAIVTMSPREVADLIVAQSGKQFPVTVTASDVVNGKPHPEAYLMAADALGVAITACVALEDSPTGFASALASGAAVIAAPFYADFDVSHAAARWDSLEGRSAEDLCGVYANHISGSQSVFRGETMPGYAP